MPLKSVPGGDPFVPRSQRRQTRPLYALEAKPASRERAKNDIAYRKVSAFNPAAIRQMLV
jgi:hypothetical protein